MKKLVLLLTLFAASEVAAVKPPLSAWTYVDPKTSFCLTDTVSDLIYVPVYIQTDSTVGLRFVKITLEYDNSYWYPLDVLNVLPDPDWDIFVNLDPAQSPLCTGLVNKQMIMFFSTPSGEYFVGSPSIAFVVRMQRTGKSGSTPIKISCSLANSQLVGELLADPTTKYYYGWGYPGTFIGNSCWDLRDVNCQRGEVTRCPDNGPTRRDCGHCPPTVTEP